MRLQPRLLVLSSCAAAALASAQAAGTVDVTFVNPAHFADVGATASDRQTNLRTLSEHLRSLGQQHLTSGQALKIDVLDVDLAGELRPSRRRLGDVRITKGMADWPRISVRYVLQADGRVIRTGDETIADMAYGQSIATDRSAEPLRHEKHMLDRWFKARFGGPRGGRD